MIPFMSLPGILGQVQAYAPEQSIQFSAASSQSMSRTPSSAGNRKTFTVSLWAKPASAAWANNVGLIGQGGANNEAFFGIDIGLTSAPTLRSWTWNGSYQAHKNSSRVIRDVGGWYHFVLSVDTTTPSWKMFVNNVEVTSLTTDVDPSTGLDTMWNVGSVPMFLCRDPAGSGYFDGLLADIAFIDGLALDPTSFGEEDDYGVWRPIDISGLTFGTNGFLIQDASGTDMSGNGNNFTPANSPTDSLDVPGDKASANLGNYARMSALSLPAGVSLQNAGTKIVNSGSADQNYAAATYGVRGGKFYGELQLVTNYTISAADFGMNAGNLPNHLATNNHPTSYVDGRSSFGNFGTGNRIMWALDADTGKWWWGKDGSWNVYGQTANSNPATGTDPYATLTADQIYTFMAGGYQTGSWNIYFEPDDWTYTPPTGFKPLCTAHLPAVAPVNPGAQIAVVPYSGDNASTQNVGCGFQPDLVLIKARNYAYSHVLFDSVRGWGTDKALATNATDAEGLGGSLTTSAQLGGVSAVYSTGFTVAEGTIDDDARYVNKTGVNYTALAIGGLTHLSAGEITALVASASATITPSGIAGDGALGFGAVKYPGNATAGASVAHGLGVPPAMIAIKRTDTGGTGWIVYHEALGPGKYLILNSTGAVVTDALMFANTAPTADKFYLGTDGGLNASGGTYVAYLFANTDAIKVFSYTGNANADGPFAPLDGHVLWGLLRNASAAGSSWQAFNTVTDAENVVDSHFYLEAASAETTGSSHTLDAVSNGIKVRNGNGNINGSGHTIIGLAFLDRHFGGANATQGKAC